MLSSVAEQSPATYGLLGMLAVRSWTGYELTRQVRRSLRFVWPTSEGHLYREQKRLVTIVSGRPWRRSRPGSASATATPSRRPGGRLWAGWLATAPEEPHLQIEGILRVFYADLGQPCRPAPEHDHHGGAGRSDARRGLRSYVREYLKGA